MKTTPFGRLAPFPTVNCLRKPPNRLGDPLCPQPPHGFTEGMFPGDNEADAKSGYLRNVHISCPESSQPTERLCRLPALTCIIHHPPRVIHEIEVFNNSPQAAPLI
jgi:hypothetical protein